MKASVKYKVIYRHKDSYSISEMCRFFEVSRSGYYDFVNRLDTPAKDLPLDQMIQQCQEQCRNTYGYRRVHIWLERQGVHKNPKTVLRIMRKYNLLAVIRCRNYKHYRDTLHRYPNLLNRNFHADRPNQKWVTDISYIKTLQGTLYLSIIRDLYDNSIVAYQTGTGQNNQLVLNTIRKAKRKEGVTAELQLHSDQGFQYTLHGYFKLTQAYGITPSMSRKGNPYDNASIPNLLLANNVFGGNAGIILSLLFAIIILAAIFSTICPMLWTCASMLAKDDKSKKYKLICVIAGICVYIITLFVPYETLLNYIMTYCGYSGCVVAVVCIVRYFIIKSRDKKEGLFTESV